MRIYSFVEWEAKAVLLPWSELWSRLTVWRNGIMEGGFVFNWIAIAIYSGLEDVSDQENTAQDWSCKDFSIMVGVDVVRGAIIPLQTYIYIYKTWIDWRWLGQKHSQPILHFNFFKYIYIYIRSAIPLQIYISTRRLALTGAIPLQIYIYIGGGAISQHSLHVQVVVVTSHGHGHEKDEV